MIINPPLPSFYMRDKIELWSVSRFTRQALSNGVQHCKFPFLNQILENFYSATIIQKGHIFMEMFCNF